MATVASVVAVVLSTRRIDSDPPPSALEPPRPRVLDLLTNEVADHDKRQNHNEPDRVGFHMNDIHTGRISLHPSSREPLFDLVSFYNPFVQRGLSAHRIRRSEFEPED